MGSRQVLDRVQAPSQIEALAADPGSYAEAVGAELASPTTHEALAARDDAWRDALARIDAMAERVMRIRLEHALADDASLAAPTRKVFAATVTGYADTLDLLEARAREVATRGGSADPAGTARLVVEAARAALSLRAAVRRSVLELIVACSTASAATADRAARDRRVEEAARRAWSAWRRELEAIAAQPDRVAGAACVIRIASWPAQLDEPDPSLEPTFADMIELD